MEMLYGVQGISLINKLLRGFSSIPQRLFCHFTILHMTAFIGLIVIILSDIISGKLQEQILQ